MCCLISNDPEGAMELVTGSLVEPQVVMLSRIVLSSHVFGAVFSKKITVS